MVLPTEREYLVRKEQHEALVREIKLARAISKLAPNARPGSGTYRWLIAQLGSQMVRLGQRLEMVGGATSSGKLA